MLPEVNKIDYSLAEKLPRSWNITSKGVGAMLHMPDSNKVEITLTK